MHLYLFPFCQIQEQSSIHHLEHLPINIDHDYEHKYIKLIKPTFRYNIDSIFYQLHSDARCKMVMLCEEMLKCLVCNA